MNIRWDAVVDHRLRPGVEASRTESALATAADEDDVATVNVWLYGTLASGAIERPIRLQVPARFSTDVVIRELVSRLGDAFRGRVLDADGRKFHHCRVFVNGIEVDDTGRPVHRGPAPATVEMILLTAIEGG